MDIVEILNINEPKQYKVHLASSGSNNSNPLNEFWKGDFEEWQAYQTKKNFGRRYIISLLSFDSGEWLFAGVYESLSVEKRPDHYYYHTQLTDQSKSLIGRLVIKYNRSFRQSYLNLENFHEELILQEVLKERSTITRFKGFKNVSLSFDLLKFIIESNDTSWKTALENVRGIYLITDKSNGKLYVGKASGENAIWSRWRQYIVNGHGGNIDLKELIAVKGTTHAQQFFQFSIIEITDFDDERIDDRESYWKEVLQTRQFGYNRN